MPQKNHVRSPVFLSLYWSALKWIPVSRREIYILLGYVGRNLWARIRSVFICCSEKSKVLNLVNKSHP
jgi:hypothetical protein